MAPKQSLDSGQVLEKHAGVTVQLVAYAYVDPAVATRPTCRIHQVSATLAEYLLGHIAKLADSTGTISPARFQDDAALKRFETLRTGTDDEFLAVAQELTTSLRTAMDGRAAPGFVIAIRELRPDDVRAAVLKLDISKEAGAKATQAGADLLFSSSRSPRTR